MKTLGIPCALAALLLMAGCTQSEPNAPARSADQSQTAEDANSDGATSLEDVGQKASETADAARDLAKQKTDEYVQKLNDQLEQLDESIEQLDAKGDELADDAKQRWQDRRADLKSKRDEFRQKLDKFTDASKDAAGDLKEGVSAAWADLKQAFDEASKSFTTDNEGLDVKVNVGDGVDVEVGDAVDVEVGQDGVDVKAPADNADAAADDGTPNQ